MAAPTAAAGSATGANTNQAPQVSSATANADYMARSRRFPVRAPLIGGNLSGVYAPGSTLQFIFGPTNNGWLDMIEIDLNIQITMTTASAAANAGYPWNLIQGITVNLDGQISYVEPYFGCYLLPRLRRWEGSGVDAVLAGTAVTTVSGEMYTAPTTLNVGANNIRLRYRIPLNGLHALDGSGLLPVQGTQDPVQVNVIIPNTLVGNDAWNNPVSSATGTASVTGVSTVTVYGWVRDGRTLWAPGEVLPFYPNGLPQVSYDREPDVINLVAGSIVRGQMTKVLKLYYGVAVVIDGVASSKFSSMTNFNSFDLSADSSGNFKFLQYGLENIPMDLLWSDLRARFGQDWPEGVIPLVYAPESHLHDIDAGNGTDILNMMAGGWTSMYQGVNLVALGANGQPRIHTCILGTNDSPYIG